jgi:hypothetical protein
MRTHPLTAAAPAVLAALSTLPLCATSACGGAASPPPASATARPGPASCARVRSAAAAPKPVSLPRAGSTVAVARLGDKTLAYVADEDDQSVHVVDVDAGKDIATTPLPGRPAQLMFLADGRLAVAIRDRAQVEILEPAADPTRPADVRCALDTDAEPWGLAASPDDAALYVTAAWGRALDAFDAKGAAMTRQWDVALPREPRSIVVSDDGTHAFVAQAVGGQASVVDLRIHQVLPTPTHLTPQARAQGLRGLQNSAFGADGKGTSCQSFALAKTAAPAGRVLVPQALVDPGDPEDHPSGYGSPRQDQTEVGDVAVLDAATGDVLLSSLQPAEAATARSMRSGAAHDHQECLLPRAAAYDAKRQALLVGCFGIDDVVSYDALAASPARAIRRRWDVSAGPTGIAVDGDKDRAVVWSQFERTLDVLALGGNGGGSSGGQGTAGGAAADLVDDKGADNAASVGRIALNPPTHPTTVTVALGRVLFHMVGDERISHDGRACASCHPDGRDDSLVWSTPNGPRRSMMLAGRIDSTAPFSWSGTETTLPEHVAITFQRLRGSGDLRTMELDSLIEYVRTLTPPPASPPRAEDRAKVARGDEIFHSDAAGCSTCHSGSLATDNEHHDVQSKTSADKSGSFNTPSLRFVGGGGPYFHDGRYKTLHQLLTDADRKMGHTAQLNPNDLEALEAYLRSL